MISVEAFEEILWHAFWPEKYLTDRIELWAVDDLDGNEEFELFMRNHIRKLLVLRSGGGQHNRHRYVSKNNANVSRIRKLIQLFPDAVILIPFRNPVDHVGSMLRQHQNFHNIHTEDTFARRYMKDIGHFDFGANFRPINFDNWLEREKLSSTHTADFWMTYWCAAFAHIRSNPEENLVFISYDKCCTNPVVSLQHLGNRLGIERIEDLMTKVHRFHPPISYDVDELSIDQHCTRQNFGQNFCGLSYIL